MRRKILGAFSLLLVILMISSCLSNKGIEEANYLFKADFDNEEIGSQPKDLILSFEKGNISVVEDSLSGGGMLFLDDRGNKSIKIEGVFPSQTEPVTAFIDFMQPKKGNTAKVIRLFGTAESDKAAIRIETKNKNISYKLPDGSYQALEPVEDGKWYTVEVVADIPNQRANVFVNGKMKAEGVPFQAPATDLTRFDAYTPGSSVTPHYVDNIKIVAGIAPVLYTPKEIPAPVVEDTVVKTSSTVVKPASVGTAMTYEAENAELTGAIIDTKHVGYTGDGFVDFTPNQPGGTIKWTVDVPEEAEYKLQFRYAHASGNRPLEVKVNGKVIEKSLEFQGTGDWANWQTVSTKSSLKKGTNEILVTGIGVEGGGNIDHLKIIPNTSYSAIYEAESAKSSGTIIDTKHVGYTGDGFLDFSPNQPGGTIEWNIDVPSEGEYTLQFRYAHASGNRPLEVKVNGKVIEKSLEFQGTGDWANWQTVNTLTSLKGGQNTILVTAIGSDGGGNIDHLKIIGGSVDSDTQKIDFPIVGIKEMLSKEMVDLLDDKGLFIDKRSRTLKMTGAPEIIASQTITDSLVLVTIDSGFLEFDPHDVIITAAKGTWTSLDPKLTYLLTKQAAVGSDKDGNTVVLYELNSPLSLSYKEVTPKFNGDVKQGLVQARNLITWQMDNGGWGKNNPEAATRPWDGKEVKGHWFGTDGKEIGTIDNDATIKEIRYISEIYRETKEKDLKDSVQKAIDFLLTMQYDTGGFPQVYPQRDLPGGTTYYSNYVTFNDSAMINVLDMFDDIINSRYPFDSNIVSDGDRAKIQDSMDMAIDYILKAQIKVDGKLTAWCAQHDPVTYEPRGARAYEHPSISGFESVGIVKFLMSRPNQTPAIQKSVDAAIEWFKEAKVEGKSYRAGDKNKVFFVDDPKGSTWYRFYDVKTMEPIFSGRDGVIKHSIQEIEEERQYGYSWAGVWPQRLLEVVDLYGYYPGKFYAEVVNTKSKSLFGAKSLDINAVKEVTSYDRKLSLQLSLKADGSGDYPTIQAAIDSVPAGNTIPYTIKLGKGTYTEVITIPRDKGYISLIGANRDKTIITYDNYSGKDNGRGGTIGTSGSSTAFLLGSHFLAKNLTFENSFDEASSTVKDKQAVAVKSEGDMMVFDNCRLVANQDTLYANVGRQYFEDCIIEGDIDFIFGAAKAVFKDCKIISVDKGSSENNGYITAASTPKDRKYGFLFIDCDLTSSAKDGTVHLGRPWHPGGSVNAIASVVFRDCKLGAHIKSEPWTDMSGFSWKEARFYEYNNKGDGAGVNGSRPQLTKEQASEYTKDKVLEGWKP